MKTAFFAVMRLCKSHCLGTEITNQGKSGNAKEKSEQILHESNYFISLV